MQIWERVRECTGTVWPWAKGILTITVAGTMITLGNALWASQVSTPVLHNLEAAIQWIFAIILGLGLAAAIYFAKKRKSFATMVISFVAMYTIMVITALFTIAEEKLGKTMVAGVILFPIIAAVATKAANIASQKRGMWAYARNSGDRSMKPCVRKTWQSYFGGPSHGRRAWSESFC